MKNFLSFVVLNYSSFEDTKKCVNNLVSLDTNYSIIIVDNMSPDGSYGALKEAFSSNAQVSVIQTDHNAGYAAGNNYGIRYAIDKYDPQFISIINPDVLIPEKAIIEKLCRLLSENERCMFVGGKPVKKWSPNEVLPTGWNVPNPLTAVFSQSLLWRNNVNDLDFKGNSKIRVDCIAGCFFIAKTKLFREVGFFDEGTFLYNEENILGIRSKRKGYYGIIDLSLCYYHNHFEKDESNISFHEKIVKTRETYKSRRYMILKYYSIFYLPLLWAVEFSNKIILSASWIKNYLLRVGKKVKE